MTGKGKTWSRGTNSRLPFAFNVKLTGLKSLYGKIFSPLTEISGTEPACPLISTRRKFYKGIRGKARSRTPGSNEEAHLSFSTSKDDYVDVLCVDPAKDKLTFMERKIPNQRKKDKHPSGRAGFLR